MTREGRVTTVPGHRQDARGEAARARRDRRHPGAGQAARQVPDRADRGHAPAGLRAQARPQALRRARDRLARRAARRRRGGQDPRAARLRPEGRGRSSSRRSPSRRPTGGPAPRVVLSRAEAVAEEVVAALRAHPASDRVEVAGSLRRRADSVKDLDIIATASDPKALASALAELELVESVHVLRRGGRARDRPTPA